MPDQTHPSDRVWRIRIYFITGNMAQFISDEQPGFNTEGTAVMIKKSSRGEITGTVYAPMLAVRYVEADIITRTELERTTRR